MGNEQQIPITPAQGEQLVPVSSENSEQQIIPTRENITVTEATSYNRFTDKPQINGVELVGNKVSSDIHVQHEMDVLSVQEIERILYLN